MTFYKILIILGGYEAWSCGKNYYRIIQMVGDMYNGSYNANPFTNDLLCERWKNRRIKIDLYLDRRSTA